MLYTTDSERDHLPLVQALLLLTLWSARVDDPKGPKYWLSACLSIARESGLNRNPASYSSDPKSQRLRKRIWWSIYVREKQVAIGFRQQARITDDECDVPLIEMEDFDREMLSPLTLHALGPGLGDTYDLGNQEKLAALFIEQARLSICMSDILAAQYTADALPIGRKDKMTLAPKKTAINEDEVRRCDLLLQRWFYNISDNIRYSPSSCGDTLSPGGRVIYLHSAALTLMYLATSSALHRPVITSPTSQSTDAMNLSESRACYAGPAIASIVRDLYDRDLVRYMSTTATTFLIPAMTTLIMMMKCASPGDRMLYLDQFCHCREVLLQLEDAYPLAGEAISFVNLAAREAGTRISDS